MQSIKPITASFKRGCNKIVLFLSIWGLRATIYKIIGRSNIKPKLSLPHWNQDILVIGCGQFGFSSLAPRLLRLGIFSPIRFAYDVNKNNLNKFCTAFSCSPLEESELRDAIKSVGLVYICSDHASHFHYTSLCVAEGVDVYCEKPITTNRDQVLRLRKQLGASHSTLYSGYNRPHSPAIAQIRANFDLYKASYAHLAFNVAGHFLDDSHWYRSKGQGSRIYGNIAHWIDLLVHIAFWFKNIPEKLKLEIINFNPRHSDEDIALIVTSPQLTAVISFFCRTEPFTGVHENLSITTDAFQSRILNFQTLETDFGNDYICKRFGKKSAGHSEAIQQPNKFPARPDMEFFISELLLDHILRMTKDGQSQSVFMLRDEIRNLISY